jgi:hypothetical protein
MIKKTASRITYPDPSKTGKKTYSTYRQATAATVHGVRGLTLSGLHMTEAAFYPYDGAFTALMNTVSKDPDNVVGIETTANGMEGPGQAYYECWQAAVAGDNEFLAMFLPWWEDPEYIFDPDFASDAPRDDYEKFLMSGLKDENTGKKIKLGKDRIAWFRQTLFTKCEGSLDRWRQEYPASAEEAFIATGQPAFTVEEVNFAQQSTAKPLAEGRCILSASGKSSTFERSAHGGDLMVWEAPQAGHHYFAGVDTARGEETNITAGDYAAMVVWNAETGYMAASYQSKVSPEALAEVAAAVGYWFNNAMLNVELNNLGYVVMRELRDRIFYPSQYLWKGRDDRAPGKASATAFGFETSDRHRRMMFNLFRTALYRKECVPKDKRFVQQMQNAKMEMGFRWNIAVGHDDIFMAGLLGWVAKEQYHPHVCRVQPGKNILLTQDDIDGINQAKGGGSRAVPEFLTDPTTTAFGGIMLTGNAHLSKLSQYHKKKAEPQRLQGI